MTHIRAAIEQAERWLEEVDRELDQLTQERARVASLIAALHKVEQDPSLLLPHRPRRPAKATLASTLRRLLRAN